jgi:HPt (histidine-containing phosphotransfer) domain-containing protein
MESDCKLPAVEEVAGLMGLPIATAVKLLGMAPDRLGMLSAEIRAAIAAGDWDTAAKGAHAARGVCSNLRLQPLVDMAYAIEQCAKNQGPAENGDGLCSRFDAYVGELKRMLSGGGAA